jgi:hypothetical protein
MKVKVLIIAIILPLFSFVLYGQDPMQKRFTLKAGTTVNMKDSHVQLNPTIKVRKLPKPHPGTDRLTIEKVTTELSGYRLRRASGTGQQQRSAAADSLVVLRNFNGNQFNGFVPNDNDMAISNHDEVCSVANTTIVSKDQVNNVQYGSYTLHFISQSLGLQNEEFDPKVLYDPGHDRFIMVCLNGFTDSTSNVVVGFSQDSSSHGSWHFYSLPGDPLNNDLWTDFPMIAVNDDYLFLTANLLYNDSTWQAGFNESIVWQISLTEGYSASTLNPLLHYNFLYNGEPIRNLCPVKGGSGSYGPDFYLLSNRNFAASSDTTFLVTIPPGPSPVPSIQPVIAPTGYHMPLDADQPFVDKLQVNDARYLGAFYENDVIQAVSSTLDTVSGNDGIYHLIIDNVTGLISANANIYTAPALDLAYPNIAWAGYTPASNAAVISLLQSSSTVNPGCGAVYYDDAGTYSGITTVYNGISYTNMLFGKERWGDYTGCQTRFNMPGVVWMNGSYSAFNHTTRTWIAELAPSVISSVQQTEKPLHDLVVYPNPSPEVVHVEFQLAQPDRIEVTLSDISGRLVSLLYKGSLAAGENEFSFTIDPLPVGVYVLRITDSAGNILASERVVKGR